MDAARLVDLDVDGAGDSGLDALPVEIASLLLGLISTVAVLWSLSSRTERRLIEIRDVLIEVRDRLPRDLGTGGT
jgi:hypothetical protein